MDPANPKPPTSASACPAPAKPRVAPFTSTAKKTLPSKAPTTNWLPLSKNWWTPTSPQSIAQRWLQSHSNSRIESEHPRPFRWLPLRDPEFRVQKRNAVFPHQVIKNDRDAQTDRRKAQHNLWNRK